MMKYLRDPIWQFFGFVATVVGILVAIVLRSPALVQRWWLPGLLGAAALISLVGVLRLWRVIARGLAWASQQIKRSYIWILWHLVVRPARDHLNVIVSREAGTWRHQGVTPLPDRRIVEEAKRMELSGATVYLPEELGGVELVRIPAGEFSMGDWAQQPVSLDTYYISRYPITNAQYKRFIEREGHASPSNWTGGREYHITKQDHPVVHVSWHDARTYCNWLSKETGQVFRLPTEAEWEKAAQGPDRRTYPWGDDWDKWNCNSAERQSGDTTAVGEHSPEGDSRFGVGDMAGNVWEWTNSLHRHLPYVPDNGREDSEAPGERVLRGGSFKDRKEQVSCAYRIHNQPKATGEEIGFRIAASVK